MPFNSDNLTIFLTVLDKGSFSAAARALKTCAIRGQYGRGESRS